VFPQWEPSVSGAAVALAALALARDLLSDCGGTKHSPCSSGVWLLALFRVDLWLQLTAWAWAKKELI